MPLKTTLTCVLLALVLGLPGAAYAEDPPSKADPAAEKGDGEDGEAKVGPADQETVRKLLAEYRKAVSTKEGEKVRAALEAFLPYDNPEFKPPALKELRYKATGPDKKVVNAEARKKNVRKQKRRLEMLFEFEQTVQITAVKVLSKYPDKEVQKAFRKAFANKQIRDDKPLLAAAVIEGMGTIGYTKCWSDIESEFKKFRNMHVMKAAVRYFGMTKEKRVAKMLCDHIEEPMPANVNSGSNPPSSYWKVRWEAWNNMKDDVVWALEQITGETFTTNKQARDWISDHAREHGYK
jgi:hypothetical protein